jgi:hypothetical protein
MKEPSALEYTKLQAQCWDAAVWMPLIFCTFASPQEYVTQNIVTLVWVLERMYKEQTRDQHLGETKIQFKCPHFETNLPSWEQQATHRSIQE